MKPPQKLTTFIASFRSSISWSSFTCISSMRLFTLPISHLTCDIFVFSFVISSFRNCRNSNSNLLNKTLERLLQPLHLLAHVVARGLDTQQNVLVHFVHDAALVLAGLVGLFEHGGLEERGGSASASDCECEQVLWCAVSVTFKIEAKNFFPFCKQTKRTISARLWTCILDSCYYTRINR